MDTVVVLSRQPNGALLGCVAASGHGLALLTQLHGFQVYDTSSLVRNVKQPAWARCRTLI
jgi:hypothetical protein